jgi:hypothetical protein
MQLMTWCVAHPTTEVPEGNGDDNKDGDLSEEDEAGNDGQDYDDDRHSDTSDNEVA